MKLHICPSAQLFGANGNATLASVTDGTGKKTGFIIQNYNQVVGKKVPG